jgi:uncharacterized membrane protein
MDLDYGILLFLHIAAAIAWIGSGLLLQVLIEMANRRRDEPTFGALVRYTAELGLKLFVPASLVVLVFGLALVANGPWTFGQLWVVLGLVGFATTFVTGAFVLKPRADRLAEVTPDDGVLGPEAKVEALRLLALGRLDYVVLGVIVFDMAVKPTGDDVGVLLLMALTVAVGVAFVLSRVRRLGAPEQPNRGAAATA